MGYLFLSISLLAGATKGYCGKKMGDFAANVQSAALLNLVRMILCTGLGMLVVFAYKHTSYLTLNTTVIAISAISGISTSVFVVTWLVSVRKSAYMMLDIFLMLGTLVPMISGYFAFGESITLNQWIGFFVLVLAVIIMCSYNNSIKTKLRLSSFLLLVLCGLANGITDFSQKMFVKMIPQVPISIFNLYSYIFAAITLAVVYAVIAPKDKAHFDKSLCGKYMYIVIMSVMLIANSYFKTKAAIHLDSAQLYPLNQGMALILSTLMASVLFKEKLTAKCVIGICIAFAGLLIMNVL